MRHLCAKGWGIFITFHPNLRTCLRDYLNMVLSSSVPMLESGWKSAEFM